MTSYDRGTFHRAGVRLKMLLAILPGFALIESMGYGTEILYRRQMHHLLRKTPIVILLPRRIKGLIII